MTRVLVTGASGFVGSYLLERLADLEKYQVSATYCTRQPQAESDNSAWCQASSWHQADLNHPDNLDEVFQQTRPDAVVHLAAVSDVTASETDPRQATAVNVTGTENIARLCRQYQAHLVFLSTDYVFDGQRGYYREEEPPQPVLHYGLTKWEAELALRRELPGSSILRTSLMYGWPVPGGHGNLATGVINNLENQRPFCGYTDMYRSPTYVGDVVEGVLRLIPGRHPGTHHLAGPEWVNMGDFARAVAEVFRLDSRLVEPAESEGYNASRPRLLGLDPTQTAKRLGMRLSGMISGLEQMQYKRRGDPWLRRY
ncbi:MAG: SDR family oxidoreductase [Dehalococcoidia bacterium]